MSKEATRFKQTEIGELPKEWEVVRLGELAVINPTYPLQRGREYSFIPMEALDENFPKVKFIQKRIWKGGGSRFKCGDVLLARITPSAENGKTAIVDFLETYEFGFGSTEFIVFSPKTEITTSLYVYYLLKWSNVRNKLINQMTGTTGRQRIPNDAPYYVFVPLPPLEEQRRIAGVLRLVDRVAEETKRIINIYEGAKKFALKHLLTKGIGHTRFKQTEIGELPEEWEVVKLGDEDVARVFAGSSAPQRQEYFENGIFPFVRVQDLARYGQTRCLREVADKVNEKAVQEHHMVFARKGTIVFPKSGAALEKNHRAILGVDAYIVSHLAAVEANTEKVDNEFLFWWLCRVDMASLNPNPGYPSIRLEEIKTLPIPLPPLEEQKQIAEMLNTIDAAIENERKYLGILEKCKRWLLDNLLTGKVRLPQEVDEILKGVLPDAL
jgi:type I restriction enzyme S subunit